MFKELKKLLMPRKLWILRLYIALLTFIVEFLLGAYVLVSIYNLITSDNALGDLVLGFAGLYLVWVCLAILFVIQVVSLFLNIHDNIEDVRNKAINQDFAVDLKEEKEKSTEASLSSIGTIAIIVLSIILSFVNLNRENKDLLSSNNSIDNVTSQDNYTDKKGSKSESYIQENDLDMSKIKGEWNFSNEETGWFFNLIIEDDMIRYLEYKMGCGYEILKPSSRDSRSIYLHFYKNECNTKIVSACKNNIVGHLELVNGDLFFVPTGIDPCGYIRDEGLGVFKNGNRIKMHRVI